MSISLNAFRVPSAKTKLVIIVKYTCLTVSDSNQVLSGYHIPTLGQYRIIIPETTAPSTLQMSVR